MHRLKDVRSLQTIQHHVKYLVLGTSIMPEISWEQWQHDFSMRDISGISPQPTSSEVATRYEQYSRLFHQQQRFIDGNNVDLTPNSAIEMPSYIAKAIQTFRHLSTVIIGEGPWIPPRQHPITCYHPLYLWCQTWQDLWMTRIRELSLQPETSSAFERTVLQNVPKPGKSFLASHQHLDELPHWRLLRQFWVPGEIPWLIRINVFSRLCIIKFGVRGTPSDELLLADLRNGFIPP